VVITGALACTFLILAQTKDACRLAYAELRYDDAAHACSAAIAGADRSDRPELYRITGESFTAIGDRESARRAFESWLAIDPGATLDESVSPKIRDAFDRARKEKSAVSIGLELIEAPAIGRAGLVRVTIADGATRPIVRLILHSPQETRAIDRPADDKTIVEISAWKEAGPIALSLEAHDAFGGPIASASLTVQGSAPVDDSRSWALSWKLWGAAALAVGVTAGGVGLYSRHLDDRAQSDVFADDAAHDHQVAKSTAIAADVALISTLVFAAGAALLFATDGGS
jgi:hypothetical protein